MFPFVPPPLSSARPVSHISPRKKERDCMSQLIIWLIKSWPMSRVNEWVGSEWSTKKKWSRKCCSFVPNLFQATVHQKFKQPLNSESAVNFFFPSNSKTDWKHGKLIFSSADWLVHLEDDDDEEDSAEGIVLFEFGWRSSNGGDGDFVAILLFFIIFSLKTIKMIEMNGMEMEDHDDDDDSKWPAKGKEVEPHTIYNHETNQFQRHFCLKIRWCLSDSLKSCWKKWLNLMPSSFAANWTTRWVEYSCG